MSRCSQRSLRSVCVRCTVCAHMLCHPPRATEGIFLPHGIFGYRAVKLGLRFWLISESWIWVELTFDKHTSTAMRITPVDRGSSHMKEWALQSVSGPTSPFPRSLVSPQCSVGVEWWQSCLEWSGSQERHCFYTEQVRDSQGKDSHCLVQSFLQLCPKVACRVFFLFFSFYSPQTCIFSTCSLRSPHSQHKVFLCCFLTMQLILFLKNFYSCFWHLKNGMMSARAGIHTLEGFCGPCNNHEISPSLKLIALDLISEIPSFCLSCFHARWELVKFILIFWWWMVEGKRKNYSTEVLKSWSGGKLFWSIAYLRGVREQKPDMLWSIFRLCILFRKSQVILK